jgi:endonuclease/exonuclease/phosphatase family metal-dependent hydrolase
MADLRLRVMTYNMAGHDSLWSGRHLERVAQVILAAAPDLVGLQEVHRKTRQSRLVDQAAELGRLTGMAVRFGKSYMVWGGGEFGNAVLARGDFLSREVLPLPGPGEPRTVLHTIVHTVAGVQDSAVHFYVTHLAAWGRWKRAARGVQVMGLVEQLQRAERPFVLVGDFNAPPEAPEIAPLMTSGLLRLCGNDATVTNRYMRERIDYVFADPGWTPASYQVIRSGPSDHWPVLVELRRSNP